MTAPWISLIVIYYVTITGNQIKLLEATDNIYLEIINITWEAFRIFQCGKQTTMFVSKYECYPEESTMITTAAMELKNTTSFVKPNPYECQNKSLIGSNCSILNDLCTMLKPCQNQGVCYLDEKNSLKYKCKCSMGYTGRHCEFDDRICNSNTCWHDGDCVEMNTTVSIDNQTTFKCYCKPGYDGLHCELIDDMCTNVTCQNSGICFSSHLDWICRCRDSSLYSGKYCEIKSSILVVKEALSKSFASVAIVAIIAVFLFVFTMDVLKYLFKIDPIDRERKLMELERTRKQKEKLTKNRDKKSTVKSFYIT